ncbi:MAG: hypothetical protein ACTSV7_08150 [Candidatus Baldrarchaeia archaeon]
MEIKCKNHGYWCYEKCGETVTYPDELIFLKLFAIPSSFGFDRVIAEYAST